MLDRVEFEKYKQKEGEDFESFYISTQQLAFDADLVNNHCGECSKKCLESRVANKIMAGIMDADVRTKLLKIKEEDFSLASIVTICRTEENSKKNEQKLSSKNVNYVAKKEEQFQRGSARPRSGKPTQRYGRRNSNERYGGNGPLRQRCPNCGRTHEPNNCNASNKKCDGCGEIGHYVRVCPENEERSSDRY